VYVADTVNGLITLAEHDATSSGTFNIATGEDVSVGEVVDIVGELLGRELTVQTHEERLRPANSEVHRLLGDATMLRDATGWAPATSLRDGLGALIEWMRTTALPSLGGTYAV
jgi:nucleoside-diphosphate-sugar epimerase